MDESHTEYNTNMYKKTRGKGTHIPRPPPPLGSFGGRPGPRPFFFGAI